MAIDVPKIISAGVDRVRGLASKIEDTVTRPIESGEKLLGSLEKLAQCPKAQIVARQESCIPEFIYHITSAENYKKILDSRKLKFSEWETRQNGCPGIYFIDKQNFLNHWRGCKLFEENASFPDMAELLYVHTQSSKLIETTEAIVPVPYAIQIPTTALDKQKLLFRPAKTAYIEMVNTLDDNMVSHGKLKNGLPLSELYKWIVKEPVEYIYTEEIPTDLFSKVIKSSFVGVPENEITTDKILESLFS